MPHHTDTAPAGDDTRTTAPVLPRAVPVLFPILAAACACFATMEATLRAVVS